MILRVGDMWSEYENSTIFVITTCGVYHRDRELVMGRGIALEASARFPGLARRLASAASRHAEYGFVMDHITKIAALQSKIDWRNPSTATLIYDSIARMMSAARFSPGRFENAHMAFPGIGNGRLTETQVMPLIEVLPDNFTIWKRK